MKSWQVFSISVVLCLIAFSLLVFGQYKTRSERAPEEIEIHHYYNEGSQVECFYHRNAISCLWVMDGGK